MIVARVAEAARYLADLIARLVGGVPAVLAIAVGCNTADEELAKPALPAATVQAKASVAVTRGQPAVDEGPQQLGFFTITFYYMIGEDEVVAKKPANDNAPETELAAVEDTVTLFTMDKGACSPIADVSRDFAQQLALQGSGKLRDGRVLNIWGHCRCDHAPCFKVIPNQWGTAGSGHPLQPFRTVAVDPKVVKLGTLLYVPLLEGRTMPGRAPWGGFVHDGCVVADDTGGFGGQKLDLFVARKGYFFGLGRSGTQTSHAWAKHVPVYDGSKICQRRGQHVARKTGAI